MARRMTSILGLLLVQLLSVHQVSAQSMLYGMVYPIEFQSGTRLTGFAVVDVASWEEYKRIRLGEAKTAKDDRDGDDLHPPSESKRPVPHSETTVNGKEIAPAPAPDTGTPRSSVPAPYTGVSLKDLTPRAPASAREPAPTRPDPKLITAPEIPTETGDSWAFYLGTMDVDSNPHYGPHGIDFQWAYARKNPLPSSPRIVVYMHGSGGAMGAMGVFGPSADGDIEIRTQDEEGYDQKSREWWTFGNDGQPYPGRRIAAMLRFVTARYGIDVGNRGIVLKGDSMGGTGAVIQTMILPDPWREKIAYSSGRIGAIMPRQIAQRDPGQYSSLAPDGGRTRRYWDAIDFSLQAPLDPIVRGMHYRHTFSSDDQFSQGLRGNTQLQFVNLVEQHRISGAFVWFKAGHGLPEPGVDLPDTRSFERPEQDVTLDRAHPAITNSTGNYPVLARDRINGTEFPRGHYNMGITWNHSGIIDDASQIVFPLKYQRRTAMGKDIPDQPPTITISVTPRRPRHFVLNDGETLKWSWDGGVRSGFATVDGDTVTIDSLPLASGADYKNLRIFR